MDAPAYRDGTRVPEQKVTWLSGEIVTFFNKIGALIWLAVVVGVPLAFLLRTGHLFIAPAFRPFIAFVLLASAFILWLSRRIQRVGYTERDLIVSNYSRQERIPFEQVQTAEPVWWYYRRMVRIQLRSRTSFGQVVYYIPKWAVFKCFWGAPERELQNLLATNRGLPSIYPEGCRLPRANRLMHILNPRIESFGNSSDQSHSGTECLGRRNAKR
jgi:hypothetical protein